MDRRALTVSVVVAVVILAQACGGTATSTSSGQSKAPASLTMQLAWYALPEYGGVYAAESKGYFKDENLDVTIKPGGPQISATQIVGAGQAEVGFLNSDEFLLHAMESKLPYTVLMADLQDEPNGVIYHTDHPLSSFSGMSGRTVYTLPGTAGYAWLQHKYHLDSKTAPYSYANFAHDPTGLLLAYVTNAKPSFQAQGVDINWLLYSQAGFYTYGDLLFTTNNYLNSHKDVLKRLLSALTKGWSYYRNHYKEVDQYMHQFDPGTDAATMDQIEQLQDTFEYGGQAATKGIGYVDASRTKKLESQMLQAGALTSSPGDVTKTINMSLLPKVLPPAKSGN